MSGLIHFWLPRRARPEAVRLSPISSHGLAALGKMLHHLLEAIREGISARRKYEHLTSMGIGHDPALKAALSETDHCRQACARRASARSAFHGLMAAVGAWIDSRRECKPQARLDERLPGDVSLTRSRHRKRDRLRSALGLNAQPAIRS